MHTTALRFARLFFRTYVPAPATILDIGAMDLNGSLRPLAPPGSTYIGIDVRPGPGVDLVLDDPYVLPFASRSIDVCVSNSCFEHAEFFWLLYLEILRVLKPTGLFYLNVPSSGRPHPCPVDCWRFYPDSAAALVNWGRRNGYTANVLLESFTNRTRYASLGHNHWQDYIAVFLKDEAHIAAHPRRLNLRNKPTQHKHNAAARLRRQQRRERRQARLANAA